MSNVSRGQAEFCQVNTTPNLPVRRAIHASMSLPFLWQVGCPRVPLACVSASNARHGMKPLMPALPFCCSPFNWLPER